MTLMSENVKKVKMILPSIFRYLSSIGVIKHAAAKQQMMYGENKSVSSHCRLFQPMILVISKSQIARLAAAKGKMIKRDCLSSTLVMLRIFQIYNSDSKTHRKRSADLTIASSFLIKRMAKRLKTIAKIGAPMPKP